MVHITGPLPLPVSIAAIIAALDVSDRPGRLLGIIYGNLAQVQQLAALADGVTPTNLLSTGSFPHVYDPVAGDWNRQREGAVIGSGLVDVTDRAARLLGIAGRNWVLGALDIPDLADRAGRLVGITYGSLAQIQQIANLAADGLTPANVITSGGFLHVYDPVAGDWNRWREGAQIGVPMVEDTGLNTNPRRYEKDNGFYSAVTAVVGPAATALWTIATTPARTAGQVTTIYTLTIENSTGAAITVWLEIGGTAITIPFHVANTDSIVIDFIGGLNSGDADVNCNASAAGVNVQIMGTEA